MGSKETSSIIGRMRHGLRITLHNSVKRMQHNKFADWRSYYCQIQDIRHHIECKATNVQIIYSNNRKADEDASKKYSMPSALIT